MNVAAVLAENLKRKIMFWVGFAFWSVVTIALATMLVTVISNEEADQRAKRETIRKCHIGCVDAAMACSAATPDKITSCKDMCELCSIKCDPYAFAWTHGE